jgi:hypothetical protein
LSPIVEAGGHGLVVTKRIVTMSPQMNAEKLAARDTARSG